MRSSSTSVVSVRDDPRHGPPHRNPDGTGCSGHLFHRGECLSTPAGGCGRNARMSHKHFIVFYLPVVSSLLLHLCNIFPRCPYLVTISSRSHGHGPSDRRGSVHAPDRGARVTPTAATNERPIGDALTMYSTVSATLNSLFFAVCLFSKPALPKATASRKQFDI